MSEGELLDTLLDDRMFYVEGEPIRFRVDSVEWQDVRPEPAADDPAAAIAHGANGGEGAGKERDPYEKAGFKILVRHELHA